MRKAKRLIVLAMVCVMLVGSSLAVYAADWMYTCDACSVALVKQSGSLGPCSKCSSYIYLYKCKNSPTTHTVRAICDLGHVN